MDKWQERKFRRFDLEWPAHVRFRSGDAIAEVDTVTRNISQYGLLLESACFSLVDPLSQPG